MTDVGADDDEEDHNNDANDANDDEEEEEEGSGIKSELYYICVVLSGNVVVVGC